MSSPRWLSGSLLALAVVAGAALWMQRHAATELRDEIGLLRDDQRELARLVAENRWLAAALPPASTLEELRADRAAVVRLRGEIEKARDNLLTRERALASPVPAAAALAPPALVAAIAIGLDGNLVRDGLRFDPAALRQQLSALPRGGAFEIRLQLPKAEAGSSFDKVKQGIDAVAQSAKQAAQDFGLKLSLRTEAPPK